MKIIDIVTSSIEFDKLGIKHFTSDEFRCHCCGELFISVELLQLLDKARILAGVPFKITSGYRCPSHNAKVGGVPKSSHLSGLAVDVAVSGDRNRGAILIPLLVAGFRRVGIGPTMLHVDIDDQKTSGAVWLYPSK